jgi:tRNA threonylcarbamoyladenosine biosynthesis protein TsaB
MKLLAIDAATEACSAALLVDGTLLARYEVIGRGHAERLLPMVDELLAEAGLSLTALDALAFGRGPGAFTGVRIAVGLAQGLAFGAGLPVVPVSNLAALGRLALDEASAAGVPVDRALACLDARMNEVYWAEVVARADGGVDVRQERLGSPGTVGLQLDPGGSTGAAQSPVRSADSATLAALEAGTGATTVGAGHGWRAYPALVERFPALALRLPDLLPRAHEIARLGALDAAAGRAIAAEDAAPVYLRDDVATRSGRSPPGVTTP